MLTIIAFIMASIMCIGFIMIIVLLCENNKLLKSQMYVTEDRGLIEIEYSEEEQMYH